MTPREQIADQIRHASGALCGSDTRVAWKHLPDWAQAVYLSHADRLLNSLTSDGTLAVAVWAAMIAVNSPDDAQAAFLEVMR